MKHAIMILAHNNFSVVEALLEQFDAPEFDIYIHINAKVKSFPKEKWERAVHHAGLTFVPRVKVGYCDYSMVSAVMSLFRTALQTSHDYYHLISGADLLIKKRSDFFEFFEKNKGKEFVGFSDSFDERRVYLRNYFIAGCRSGNRLYSKVCRKAGNFLLILQQKLGLRKKIRHFAEVKKGCDWYSLTEPALRYLVSEEPNFRKDFYRSFCPTEFFPHTVLYDSAFRESLYDFAPGREGHECIRTIDWNRGSPYVFTIEDKDFLLESDGMFARKFDENKDLMIVKYFKDYVKG